MSRHLIHNIYIMLVQKMATSLEHLVFSPDQTLFQVGDEVEIDEALMYWREDGVWLSWLSWSRDSRGEWIVGLISRRKEGTQQRLKLFCAEGRSREDLIDEIEDEIESHTRIYTDALSTYTALKENYDHYVINKATEGFLKVIHPRGKGEIKVHVNSIESTWSKVRGLARKRSLNTPADIPYLIIEYMYVFYQLCWFDLARISIQPT